MFTVINTITSAAAALASLLVAVILSARKAPPVREPRCMKTCGSVDRYVGLVAKWIGLRVVSDYLPTRESGEKVVCPLSNSK